MDENHAGQQCIKSGLNTLEKAEATARNISGNNPSRLIELIVNTSHQLSVGNNTERGGESVLSSQIILFKNQIVYATSVN